MKHSGEGLTVGEGRHIFPFYVTVCAGKMTDYLKYNSNSFY